MEEQLLRAIITCTFTLQDAYHRVGLLRRFFEATFFADGGSHMTLPAYLEKEGVEPMAVRILGDWGSTNRESIQPDKVHTQFETVRKRLDAFPVMILAVPVAVTNSDIREMGTWLRANVDPSVFIDLTIDPAAVGGCRIVWRGKHADYTFRRYAVRDRAKIKAMLRAYVTS